MPAAQEENIRRVAAELESEISQKIHVVASALASSGEPAQTYSPTNSESTAELPVLQNLRQLLASQRKLDRCLQLGHALDDETEVVRSAAKQRRLLLTALRTKLDAVGQQMRCVIDDCAEGIEDVKYQVPPDEIIAYAQRLRYTSYATLGILPGQPPAPQPWHMMNSALHQFARSQPHEPQAPQQPAEMPGTAAPGMPTLPPMPPGWKPGDPLPELPAMPMLPPMPPGWKPGDPLPPPMPAGWKPGDPLPDFAQLLGAMPPAAMPVYEAMEEGAEDAEEAPVVTPAAGYGAFFLQSLNPDLEETDHEQEEDSSEEDDDF